jgi:hypothetical protein
VAIVADDVVGLAIVEQWHRQVALPHAEQRRLLERVLPPSALAFESLLEGGDDGVRDALAGELGELGEPGSPLQIRSWTKESCLETWYCNSTSGSDHQSQIRVTS